MQHSLFKTLTSDSCKKLLDKMLRLDSSHSTITVMASLGKISEPSEDSVYGCDDTTFEPQASLEGGIVAYSYYSICRCVLPQFSLFL